MAFVNPPSWQPNVSTIKFSQPQLQGNPPTPDIDEEDSGWWGGVQQAGSYIALAFALEASILSGNTAVQFQAQHQDEISRGAVIEEVYNFQDQKSLPPLDYTYPGYIAPHQDEISRGATVDEIYDYKAAPANEQVLLPAPYWFDPNEISRGPVVDEVYEYKTAPTIDPVQAILDQWTQQQDEYPTQVSAQIAYEDYWFVYCTSLDAENIQIAPYGYDSGDIVPQPGPTIQNYINTGTNNYVSQRIGEGIEF